MAVGRGGREGKGGGSCGCWMEARRVYVKCNIVICFIDNDEDDGHDNGAGINQLTEAKKDNSVLYSSYVWFVCLYLMWLMWLMWLMFIVIGG